MPPKDHILDQDHKKHRPISAFPFLFINPYQHFHKWIIQVLYSFIIRSNNTDQTQNTGELKQNPIPPEEPIKTQDRKFSQIQETQNQKRFKTIRAVR